MTGFQPAGRAPAPAPLDLLQDFVNTEIPEWAQDDLGSPAALSAWLVERGLLDPGCRARLLRRVSPGPRPAVVPAVARARQHHGPAAASRRAAAAALAELGPLRFGLAIGDDGARPSPRQGRVSTGRSRRSPRSRSPRPRRERGRGSRRAARTRAAGSSTTVAQPLLQLVLDDDLRQPVEDGRLPAPEGHRVRAALYVVGLAFGRVRRRSSGALLAAVGIAIGTAVLIGVLAGTKIAQDRSVSQAVERIPAASRSVRAVWFGVPVGADAGVSHARRDRARRSSRASGFPARRRSSSFARARSRATSSRSPASTASRRTST